MGVTQISFAVTSLLGRFGAGPCPLACITGRLGAKLNPPPRSTIELAKIFNFSMSDALSSRLS